MILQELDLSTLEAETSQSRIKDTINRLFWAWFHANQDQKITIKKWFINITVTVGQLQGLFEMLFGPASVRIPDRTL